MEIEARVNTCLIFLDDTGESALRPRLLNPGLEEIGHLRNRGIHIVLQIVEVDMPTIRHNDLLEILILASEDLEELLRVPRRCFLTRDYKYRLREINIGQVSRIQSHEELHRPKKHLFWRVRMWYPWR